MSRLAAKGVVPEPPLQIGEYMLEKVIGQGTYGKVRLGVQIHTGENVAIKVIEKSQIKSPKQVARLQREIRFLKLLNHPHIVRVIDVVETNDFIYIIMEYAVGGELFDYIVANKRVKEKEAKSFFRMVLSAVDYCHQNSIIHRDLKPENLLLDDKKNIKIIDFGFGNNYSSNELLDTFCGSPFYAAPEMILGKKYEGPEVDMWSLGVILFALLCGHLPFDDDNMKELYKKIANGSYKTPDHVPHGARHLISRLITVDPKKRATLKEVLNHSWVNAGYDGPPPNYIPKRVMINDPAALSRDITNRLEIFGYTKLEIAEAFSPNQNHSQPNAIRSTYYLLAEMVAREQARLRLKKRLSQQRESQKFSSTNTLQPLESRLSISSSDLETPITSSNSLAEVSGIHGNSEISREITRRAPQQPRAVSYRYPSDLEHSQARRQSVPLMIPNQSQKSSTAEKFKEELRAVSGWFLNFSTTTSKTQSEVLNQLFSFLGEQPVVYSPDGRCMFQCELDVNLSLFSNETKRPSSPSKPQYVTVQIEISKVPRMELNAIHFKRLAGGVWNYKKICNKILSLLVL